MDEKQKNFDFEFQSKLGDIGELEDKLRDEAETRLLKLAQKHTDVTGASIIIEHGDAEDFKDLAYRARVVAFTRPKNVAGVEEADTAMAAMRSALTSVERQVREERERLRERWQRSAGKKDRFDESIDQG